MALSGSLTKDGRIRPAAARVLRIAGVLLALGGTWTGAPVWWLMLTGERASAKVVAVADATDAAALRRDYVVTLEFDDGGGRPARIERTLRRPAKGSRLREGTAVTVAFPKGRPAQASVLHGQATWAGGYTAILVGALLFAVTFAGRRPARAT
jgi:hypothetical protein